MSSINIGPINKKDVMRANAMIERGYKKFGVILAFDVPGEAPKHCCNARLCLLLRSELGNDSWLMGRTLVCDLAHTADSSHVLMPATHPPTRLPQ